MTTLERPARARRVHYPESDGKPMGETKRPAPRPGDRPDFRAEVVSVFDAGICGGQPCSSTTRKAIRAQQWYQTCL